VSASPGTLFISYSHEDGKWLDLLQLHLGDVRVGDLEISAWDDRSIAPGTSGTRNRSGARVCGRAILIVTPHFLRSKFIRTEELPRIEARYKLKALELFWIPAEASLATSGDEHWLSSIQCVGDPKKPWRVSP